jgi:antitoxin component of MazEF toxin-antitoxin module
MIATVTSHGDNLGVRFPKSLWKNVFITENDNVEVCVRNNAIIIKRQESKKHLTTKERVAAFCDKTIEAIAEIDWGKSRGKEIW